MYQPKKAARSAAQTLLSLGLVLATLLFSTSALAESTYKVHNIDVGQGSATLVQTVGGKNILFDTGWDFAGDRLTGYLKKIGVKKLDALVISHRHMDHIGGVQKLSEKVPVDKVIGPWAKDGIPKSAMVHLGHLRRDMTKPNGPHNRPLYATATTGKVFDLGKGFVMETLWPRKNASGKAIGDYNEESVTMRVIQKAPKGGAAATFLVGGDLGVQEERWLARRMPGKLKVDWMVANHHGSRGSSQREYMVAADGGYSKFLKALIAGPEKSDPKIYETASMLKEKSKGKYASKLLHNIDPLAHNKVPIKAKWLNSLAKDVRAINDADPQMKGRFAVFSVGPNSYGHPNAIRLAESQLAGFTPITTWANGSVVMERELGSNGRWKADWKPKAVSSRDLPTVKAPKWLGQVDPERPYNNDRREANTHWQKNNPQAEVKWTDAWDTSMTWRTQSRELSRGRKDWVEDYVKTKKQALDGTKDGKKPSSEEAKKKAMAAGKRKLKKMQYPKKSEWHGLRLGQMRELTPDELQRIAIKREDPDKVKAKAVVKGKWMDKPVAPEHPASFSQKDLIHSPGRNVKSKTTMKARTRKKPAVRPTTSKTATAPRLASYSQGLKKTTFKTPARKVAAKEPAAEEPAAKKPAVKKTAMKKPAAKKTAVKKTAMKKPAAKKPAAKKPAAKKTAVKKTAMKKPAVKKPAPTKTARAKTVTPSVRKTTTTKPRAKTRAKTTKTRVRRAPVRTRTTRKATTTRRTTQRKISRYSKR